MTESVVDLSKYVVRGDPEIEAQRNLQRLYNAGKVPLDRFVHGWLILQDRYARRTCPVYRSLYPTPKRFEF